MLIFTWNWRGGEWLKPPRPPSSAVHDTHANFDWKLSYDKGEILKTLGFVNLSPTLIYMYKKSPGRVEYTTTCTLTPQIHSKRESYL